MKYVLGFMYGSGFGAACVNATLVPSGENRGYFAAAALIVVAGTVNVVLAAASRSQK